METLKQLNEDYQKLFKRDRLKLITNFQSDKVEALENLVIKSARKNDFRSGYWIEFEIGGEACKYKEGLLNAQFKIPFKEKELKITGEEMTIVRKWWQEMAIESKIPQLVEEEKEAELAFAQENHVDLKIKAVKRENGHLVYVLENGDEINHFIIQSE